MMSVPNAKRERFEHRRSRGLASRRMRNDLWVYKYCLLQLTFSLSSTRLLQLIILLKDM